MPRVPYAIPAPSRNSFNDHSQFPRGSWAQNFHTLTTRTVYVALGKAITDHVRVCGISVANTGATTRLIYLKRDGIAGTTFMTIPVVGNDSFDIPVSFSVPGLSAVISGVDANVFISIFVEAPEGQYP